jgi:hypothetical protein
MKLLKLFLPETTTVSLLVVFTFLSLPAFAQDTTTAQKPVPVIVEREPIKIETGDTVAIKSYAERFNPRKALLYAAVVPGLGQIYNKKYWKLPLVYGGFAAVTWNISRFNDIYKNYKVQLFNNLELGLTDDNQINPTTRITTGQYRTIVNKARRERDFWVIMMGAMYLLQMVDAHVDAHLKEFDLNPNLRASIQPTMEQDQMIGRQTGLSLVIKF